MNAVAGAQESLPDAPAPKPLEPAMPVPLHQSTDKGPSIHGFSGFGGAQCDAKGNLYFRVGLVYNETRILRLRPDGSESQLYTLPPDYAGEGKSAYVTFRVNASGNFHALVEAKDGVHVFSWKPDVSEPADTRLDMPEHITPSNFAVFRKRSRTAGRLLPQGRPRGFAGQKISGGV
jgi:hypothetical protein